MFPPFVRVAPIVLFRLLPRLVLLCIFVPTMSLLLARGQEARSADVRVLLSPSADCPAPCFLGVRPGVTLVEAGLEQMRASPLIQSLMPVTSSPSSPTSSNVFEVEFVPAFAIRTAQLQVVTQARGDIIGGIYLWESGIQLRDLVLTFGQPASVFIHDPLHLGLATYAGFYPQYQMSVQVVLAVCALATDSVWRGEQNALIAIESTPQYALRRGFYHDDNRVSTHWQQALYALKRTDCVKPSG